MEIRRYFASMLATAFFFVACNRSEPPSVPAAPQPKAAAAKDVYVVFEGPWAVVADPKDANSVLVLAPRTKLHRNLFVDASTDSTLAAGTYDLSVPAHGPSTSTPLDPSFAQAKIDAKSLQRALDDRSERYVIRLPRPEAYVAARRFRSRFGPSYPPDPSTEQNYVSSVSFLYTVSTLKGFSLAGAPDVGTFEPMLFQLDTPTIRFAIEPAQTDDPKDLCDTHSREAFRDTTRFLGLILFVDFPNDPSNCHDSDPQKIRPTEAKTGGDLSSSGTSAEAFGEPSTGERFPGLARVNNRPTDAGIGVRKRVSHYPLATVYLFFHGPASDCHQPILFLTLAP